MNKSSILQGTMTILAFLLCSLLFVFSEVANAGHFTVDCATELNAVEDAIDGATYFGRNAASNESNLRAKLEAASTKIDHDKFDDAVDKLLDISDKATALAYPPGKSKLDAPDALGINTAVSNAIACVASLLPEEGELSCSTTP